MALVGHIDHLSRHRVTGWAWDSAQADVPVGLVVSCDGRVIGRCLADRFRPDLVEHGIGDGHHGFDLVLAAEPPALRPRQVALRREGDGAHLPGSPRMLTVAALEKDMRSEIQRVLEAVAPRDIADAMSFLAEQTERLRDRLAAHRSGAEARRLRRGLGWQEQAIATKPAAAAAARPRALVVDDGVPRRSHDAGSDAVLSHMHALQRLGYDVGFAPATLHGDGATLVADGIETWLRPAYASIEDLLCRQAGTFDIVYLHRMTIASRYVGLVRHHQPKARVIYSVADLHFLRTMRQAEVEGRPELRRLAAWQRSVEFAAAEQSDAVITHSSFEAGLLRAHVPAGRVHVVPWAMPTRPTAVPLAQREGAAFVANYAHQPNADAARLLLDRIMPEVWARNGTLPCLLVGSEMPAWLRDLARAPAVALGAVPDLAAVFDRVRCTVAPLAFGAGIKGKVLSSLAAGVPCVCSSVAAEGLDLPSPLSDLVADDPAAFAALVLRLDADDDYNDACAEAGLAYVEAHLSEGRLDRLLREAVQAR